MKWNEYTSLVFLAYNPNMISVFLYYSLYCRPSPTTMFPTLYLIWLNINFVNRYAMMRTKEKISRTFSVRRSLLPAQSLESLHVPQSQSPLPPSSPSSSRRISRAFSHLLSPVRTPNRNSLRYMGSMTSLNVSGFLLKFTQKHVLSFWMYPNYRYFNYCHILSTSQEIDIARDSNFSLPTTPAPRKKTKVPDN